LWSLIQIDVSPIRASSALKISILGIKFTKSEKALNYKTLANKENNEIKIFYIKSHKNYVIIKNSKNTR